MMVTLLVSSLAKLASRATSGPEAPAVQLNPELDAWAMRAAAANGFGGAFAGAARAGRAPGRASAAPVATLASVARRLRELAAAWRRRRRDRLLLEDLAGVDAATLRDLGVDRSEVGSVAAELSGAAPATRRRVGVAAPAWRVRAVDCFL